MVSFVGSQIVGSQIVGSQIVGSQIELKKSIDPENGSQIKMWIIIIF
jgi:hypothetical protein